MDTCINSAWIVIQDILLITWIKHGDVCFKLAMFYNICFMIILLHFILMTYLTCLESLYDWLDWIKNNNNI